MDYDAILDAHRARAQRRFTRLQAQLQAAKQQVSDQTQSQLKSKGIDGSKADEPELANLALSPNPSRSKGNAVISSRSNVESSPHPTQSPVRLPACGKAENINAHLEVTLNTTASSPGKAATQVLSALSPNTHGSNSHLKAADAKAVLKSLSKPILPAETARDLSADVLIEAARPIVTPGKVSKPVDEIDPLDSSTKIATAASETVLEEGEISEFVSTVALPSQARSTTSETDMKTEDPAETRVASGKWTKEHCIEMVTPIAGVTNADRSSNIMAGVDKKTRSASTADPIPESQTDEKLAQDKEEVTTELSPEAQIANAQAVYNTQALPARSRARLLLKPTAPSLKVKPKICQKVNDPHSEMLKFIPSRKDNTKFTGPSNTPEHTPLFSGRIERFLSPIHNASDKTSSIYTQYRLLGLCETMETSDDVDELPSDNLIFTNMDSPWSAFICGSQGAGKSHTVSCLLENALLSNHQLGKLPNPLAGIVFHYDKFSSESTTQLCEAAYLCSSDVPVTVLVSPSNIWAMQKMYLGMPGFTKGKSRPKVLPLYLTEKQLNVSRILKLMAVDGTSGDNPLYIEMVMTLLREMAMAGSTTGFSYSAFRQKLKDQQWAQGQSQSLGMRMSLLDSFLAPSASTASTRPAASEENIWAFPPGSLTIVDLSDPFMNENDACAMFSICLSIFLEARATCGRVVGLDEAHKFLNKSGEAEMLTESLTSIIREQRHTGTRVFVATQEPTLSPKLIDLANVTVVHRFLSPAWYHVLRHHLAGAKKQHGSDSDELFETIVSLETGQALIFCPTALVDLQHSNEGSSIVKPLGSDYIKVWIRSRLTDDGGKSIMASDTSAKSVSKPAIPTTKVRMHVVNKPPPRLFAKTDSNGRSHSGASSSYRASYQSNDHQSNLNAAINSTYHTGPVAQVATQPIEPYTADASLCYAVQQAMEECFRILRWTSIHSVGWHRLWIKVEQRMGFRQGYIYDSGREAECCEYAQREMNKLRFQQGWAEEDLVY